ncbi:hypothetical protein O0L34_g5818 [Tuta absoluta]|nr:hypothetical protein O0L34_g5818 [Tuta absoluta]
MAAAYQAFQPQQMHHSSFNQPIQYIKRNNQQVMQMEQPVTQMMQRPMEPRIPLYKRKPSNQSSTKELNQPTAEMSSTNEMNQLTPEMILFRRNKRMQMNNQPPQMNNQPLQMKNQSIQMNSRPHQMINQPPQMHNQLPQMHNQLRQMNNQRPQMNHQPPQINNQRIQMDRQMNHLPMNTPPIQSFVPINNQIMIPHVASVFQPVALRPSYFCTTYL